MNAHPSLRSLNAGLPNLVSGITDVGVIPRLIDSRLQLLRSTDEEIPLVTRNIYNIRNMLITGMMLSFETQWQQIGCGGGRCEVAIEVIPLF